MMHALEGKMPDVTLAQFSAAFGWVVGQLVVMGVVDSETSKVILSVGLTAVAAAWKIADAIIRQGRAKAVAAVALATPPEGLRSTRGPV